MQLIMENWRGYLDLPGGEGAYGDLYLFEGNAVRKVSFQQKLNSLNESGQDFETFLTQWEQSAHYQLDRLDEISWKGAKEGAQKLIMNLVKQSWPMIQKTIEGVKSAGKKNAHRAIRTLGKIAGVIRKAWLWVKKKKDTFEGEHPNWYKFSVGAVQVSTIMVLMALASAIPGAMEAHAADVYGFGMQVVAEGDSLERIGEMLQVSDTEWLRSLGQLLMDAAAGGEDVSIYEIADQLGKSSSEVQTYIEAGVERIAEIDAEAAAQAQEAVRDAELAAQRVQELENITQAIDSQSFQALGEILYGDSASGLEKLQQLQANIQELQASVSGQEGHWLSDVDLSNFDEAQAQEIMEKLKGEQMPVELTADITSGDSGVDSSALEKFKKWALRGVSR